MVPLRLSPTPPIVAISRAGYVPADELGTGELYLYGRIDFSHGREISGDARANDRSLGRIAADFIHGMSFQRKSEVPMKEIEGIPHQIAAEIFGFNQHSLCARLLQCAEFFSDHLFIGHILLTQNYL